ncbi:unnamed protein product [Didymodactylos carnosus]|uniref:HIT domain-containing protein n=1 Tax=Didymodactylos carnosus TaxID=1234261 RepID=A0A813ULL7_9BILA|nr:unnamed protein product [Didymodactylos carnosus]CAF3618497.1 unnamed protein product [Didymodactylos carnosus]
MLKGTGFPISVHDNPFHFIEAEHSSLIKVKKGVEYLKTTNEVQDCLFYRIVHGESEINQLWYADDLCALLVSRSPAARLHFLITPLEHIRTINELTNDVF